MVAAPTRFVDSKRPRLRIPAMPHQFHRARPIQDLASLLVLANVIGPFMPQLKYKLLDMQPSQFLLLSFKKELLGSAFFHSKKELLGPAIAGGLLAVGAMNS
jgi:hypothetical protein